MGNKVLENAAAAAVTSLGLWLLISLYNKQCGTRALAKRLLALQEELEQVKKNRAADRAGRTRAEQQLRQVQLQLSALQASSAAATAAAHASAEDNSTPMGNGSSSAAEPGASEVSEPQAKPIVYPFRPIGHLRTCFTTRNGTPRQPLLVPAARAVLQLAPGVPPACLEGLEQYSHCWVLYVFHHNTDMAKVLPVDGRPAVFKASIRVPRLDGAKMGVLATRSPHRPVPIGLSVAQVLEVKRGRLVLGGADIVDGSPVLDIKPYVPFCDGVPQAVAPPWVQVEANDEPLHISEVMISEAAASSLSNSWQRRGQARSLYPSAAAFLELVQQVLSRDIRSLHQRTHAQQLQQKQVPIAQPDPSQPSASLADDASRDGGVTEPAAASSNDDHAAAGRQSKAEAPLGRYRVVLDGIDVTYDVDEAGNVIVQGADSTAWSWATVGT